MTAKSEVQEPGAQVWVLVHVDRECSVVYGPERSRLDGDEPLQVVPREVAERLAEALAATVALGEIPNEDWTGDHSRALNGAIEDLAAYRAAFPRADDGMIPSIPHEAEEA